MYCVSRQWKFASCGIAICVSLAAVGPLKGIGASELAVRKRQFCLQKMYGDAVTACLNVVYLLLLNFSWCNGVCESIVIVSFIDIMLVMLNKSPQD